MTIEPKDNQQSNQLVKVREIFLKREIISQNDRKVAVVYGWEHTLRIRAIISNRNEKRVIIKRTRGNRGNKTRTKRKSRGTRRRKKSEAEEGPAPAEMKGEDQRSLGKKGATEVLEIEVIDNK